jgi:hypothetical protein
MFIGEAIVVHTFEFIEVIFDQSVKRRGFGTDRWFCESNLKVFFGKVAIPLFYARTEF